MTTFIGLYRGETVGEAKIVAVSADPQLVAEVAARLLQQDTDAPKEADPVLFAMHQGRRRALRIVKTGAVHADA